MIAVRRPIGGRRAAKAGSGAIAKIEERVQEHSLTGRIVRETTVGGRPAVVPAIRGTAWITGFTQVVVDPTDPFPEGYLLSDTWPGDDTQT